MSGLATVTYAPMSTVTRHGLSPVQPLVTRLWSMFSEMTVNALRWAHNALAGVRPSPPASARFPTVGRFSFSFPWRYSVSSLAFSAVPGRHLEAFLHGADTGHLLSPFHSDVRPKITSFLVVPASRTPCFSPLDGRRSSLPGLPIVSPLRPSGYEHCM
jgi:hypothetical protein